ncbi:holin [Streptomyces sp. NPDC088770]|uniref:holin n=1 Tax=unclassified Streptomyces TaxID=2593676 RepID=UPI002DDB3663|nr:holin [Streptomyces sp. NBC_01788]WSB29740.1 holin [Streptomyces sp. NBC_01788]
MLTRAFWEASAERAVRTFAQSTLAVLGAGSFGLLDAPWQAALSTGGFAAVLAVLTAVATSGGSEGPGLTETVTKDR